MYQVTREIHFCYGHRLLKYEGKCKNIHGHNGVAVVTVAADVLDQQGMVVDFAEIKSAVSVWIDENLDHRLLLHKDDPLLAHLLQSGEPVFVMEVNPTAENIAKLIFEAAQKAGVQIQSVTLWETPSCYATYNPTRMVKNGIV